MGVINKFFGGYELLPIITLLGNQATLTLFQPLCGLLDSLPLLAKHTPGFTGRCLTVVSLGAGLVIRSRLIASVDRLYLAGTGSSSNHHCARSALAFSIASMLPPPFLGDRASYIC